MELKRFVSVVDSHTGGEPTRIVLSGGPLLRGKTMGERWTDFKENHQSFSNFLMREPRGHGDYVGALLTPPIHPEAHAGVIFMDNGGCLSMCGHGSIGTAVALVDLGMVKKTEPVTEVVLDSCVGLVRVNVDVKDGVCGEAVMSNVPAFVYKRDCEMTIPSTGQKITFDICFGGNFFAIVPAKQLDMKLVPQESARISSLGIEIRDEANRLFKVEHPEIKEVNSIELTEFTIEVPEKGLTRNCVVFAAGSIDRSPCGTGTCAKMALLAEKGKMSAGDVFVHESIIGSVFKGTIEPGPKVGAFNSVIPTVMGRAWIMGFNMLVEQEGDMFGQGFVLGR